VERSSILIPPNKDVFPIMNGELISDLGVIPPTPRPPRLTPGMDPWDSKDFVLLDECIPVTVGVVPPRGPPRGLGITLSVRVTTANRTNTAFPLGMTLLSLIISLLIF
jgi:hypothetical protein